MSSPKTPAPPPPPRPDAPAAKVLVGPEDSPVDAAKKKAQMANGLRAQYLTASPASVGIQL